MLLSVRASDALSKPTVPRSLYNPASKCSRSSSSTSRSKKPLAGGCVRLNRPTSCCGKCLDSAATSPFVKSPQPRLLLELCKAGTSKLDPQGSASSTSTGTSTEPGSLAEEHAARLATGECAELQQASSSGRDSPSVEHDGPGVRVALGLLKVYKTAISPLMPSSCRYIPTCSLYSMESYKKFGVVRGTVLTTWRLLRCNPFGSSGYDPPMWPPPHLDWCFGWYDVTE